MKVRRSAEPAARFTFIEAAIEDELDVKYADRRRRLEHLALQPACPVPGGLMARRGIEREDQPTARRLHRLHRLHLAQERFDLRRLASGGELVLAVLFLGHCSVYWFCRN